MTRYDIALGRVPPEPAEPDNQLSGGYLDQIGQLMGFSRLLGESDEGFRSRIVASTHQEPFVVTPAFNDSAVIRENIFALLSGYTSRVPPVNQHAGRIGEQITLVLKCLRENGRIHHVPEITVTRSPASSFGWAVHVDGLVPEFQISRII